MLLKMRKFERVPANAKAGWNLRCIACKVGDDSGTRAAQLHLHFTVVRTRPRAHLLRATPMAVQLRGPAGLAALLLALHCACAASPAVPRSRAPSVPGSASAAAESSLLATGRRIREADPLLAAEWYERTVQRLQGEDGGASASIGAADGAVNPGHSSSSSTSSSLVPTASPATLVALLEDYADALTHIKRYKDAISARQRAMVLRARSGVRSSVADVVSGYAALAQDFQNTAQYDSALKLLRKAADVQKLDPASASILAKFEATVLDCAGQPRKAHERLRESRRLADEAKGVVRAGANAQDAAPLSDGSAAKRPFDSGEVLQELDIVRHMLVVLDDAEARGAAANSSSSSLPAPNTAGRKKREARRADLEGLRKELVDSLLAHGWAHPQQLPREYIPGLFSSPWHSVDPDIAGSFPHLQPIVDALQEAAPALRQEYLALKAAGRMYDETECIHDAGSGSWTWYATNGFWVPRDADGCAIDTPAACALLRKVHSLGVANLTVMRTGYSALSKGARLRPHCGMTNGQLKFHLGLIVPRVPAGTLPLPPPPHPPPPQNNDAGAVQAAGAGSGAGAGQEAGSSTSPCAWIRVGNETRAWTEGGVLFFDDSFEHDVLSVCPTERVVFQFVFVHPDLGARAAADGTGKKPRIAEGH
jgi:tetratricopeptide (TPR) repeat protein